MFRLLRLSALILLLAVHPALAQRRTVNGLGLRPNLQAEYALHGDDYVLVGISTPLSTGGYQGLNLDRLGLNAGYEHFWNARWSAGATLGADAYTATRNGGDVLYLFLDARPELFGRHWNTIGSFNFRQRLGVEYQVLGGPGSQNRALTSLRLDLDRLIPLGRLALRPRLAYEARAYLRLQRDETQEKERVIDFGTLRAELGVRVSPRFDFTPWVASQTTYLNTIPQFDANNNQISGGRTNVVTPVVGLDLRLTLFRGGTVFERRQLPTQH
ncbi:hypothetical protein SAMN02745146_1391 [Hymenobacter daecheongensis DSM 21074]|uniref:Outer membrane protein beta-barrel domain-containing protein n=1 Tax=Hymenobacter daecheongensis DSM 21074 TaxID=1121955 RepID=A0A1M6D6J2_9BACT|nr:hypothetical protein [Hymenobacter daecheongensis]SHI68771.1 hypothetical protein SAMN02745146_1391 [Hymenobacter daecheongensis DSM 21074]